MKTEKEKKLEIDLLVEKIERISKKKVTFLEKTDKGKKISFKESLKRNIIKESEDGEIKIKVEFILNKHAVKKDDEYYSLADTLSENLSLAIYENDKEAMAWLKNYVDNIS